ncbi:hypothetical protein [Brevibacillus parabrevis]|uniref:hypothetical protein n=1 Tax=Brevibacillus parabrevis TaxID=54914 RepID=UPI002380B696|nr:hypothetical protein [Brevibacillus parabrevis]WDV94766.1 hypothetical protein PSE45_24510 [Brevibacillus parabrevis]
MATDAVRLKDTRSEMKRMLHEMGAMTKEVGRAGREMQSMTNKLSAGLSRMKSDVQKVRASMDELNKVKPKVKFVDIAPKFDDMKKEWANLGGLWNGVAFGTSMDGVKTEAKAAGQERAIYAGSGKSAAEMRVFEEMAAKLTRLNPYLTEPAAMALIAKSGNVDPKMVEEAARLAVTTRLAGEESVRMMTAIGAATQADAKPEQLANALQYMNNAGAGNLSLKLVDSLAQFNTANGKMLNTPEKLAAVVGEISQLSLNSKEFGALLIKGQEYNANGGLVQLLASKYEKQIQETDPEKKLTDEQKKAMAQQRAEEDSKRLAIGLASTDKDEQRIALGKMMMLIAASSNAAEQQKAMASLGGDSGNIVEKTVKIASGDMKPEMNNEVDKAYAASSQADPFFATLQAQAEAKHEAMDAIGKVTSDLSGVTALVSKTAALFTGWFNSWDETVRKGAVYMVTAVTVILTVGALATNIWTKTKAFFTTVGGLIARIGKKGKAAEEEKPLNPDAGGKRECCCCCCCDGSGAGGKKGNKSNNKGNKKNNSNKNRNGSNKSAAGNEANKQTGGKRNATAVGAVAGAAPLGISAAVPGASPLDMMPELPDMTELDSGGREKADKTEKAGGKGSWKKIAKAGLRRVPLVGTLLGVATIAGSENKVDTAAQVGAEALGGWGGAAAGAAMGAAVGSIVPGLGTAIGGAIGGIIGGFGGSMAGGAIYDTAKNWWQNRSLAKEGDTAQKQQLFGKERRRTRAPQAAPQRSTAPAYSPAGNPNAKTQSVSLTIPQLTISLHADGVLQDIPTMLKMLNDPTVSQRIRAIIERALLDALETRGGVVT